MDVKPSDFFLGPIDLFAVLVPGALGCFLIRDLAASYVFGATQPTGIERWIALALGSYILGHLLLALGFLVTLPYSTSASRDLRLFDPKLFESATKLMVETIGAESGVNPYWWAYAVVRLQSPIGSADVERADVGVKFFRSLVILLILALIRFALARSWMAAGLCTVLIALSFWRHTTHVREVRRLTLLYFLVFSKSSNHVLFRSP